MQHLPIWPDANRLLVLTGWCELIRPYINFDCL